MPPKKRAKGYSSNLLDMRYAQRLSDKEAARLAEKYGFSSATALQNDFDHWAIFYRNNWQMRDNAPSPSTVRDTAKDIAKWAKKLAGELDGLDGKTRNSIERVEFDEATSLTLRHDFEVLKALRVASADPDGRLHSFDLEPIAAGVRLLEDQARRRAETIQKVMDETGLKKPKLYESDFALVMLVNNVRSFWENEVGAYKRSFDDFDDETGKPASVPKNAASKFTVEIVHAIAPHYSSSQVERAMKELISEFGQSALEAGQKNS